MKYFRIIYLLNLKLPRFGGGGGSFLFNCTIRKITNVLKSMVKHAYGGIKARISLFLILIKTPLQDQAPRENKLSICSSGELITRTFRLHREGYL